ncbi:MAG TPA: hypothetical protein VG106_02860, partial [Vicinamibacterales bacterium]|nr:hypothetical protein [Vicinamibacterales bacterium]
VPLDAERAETLVHYACAKGHRLACQSLHQKGIIPASVTLPARPAWVKRDGPDAPRVGDGDHLLAALEPPTNAQRTDAQARAPEPPASQPAPAVRAQAASNAAPTEATLIAKCLAAARDACYDLARGYERGDGMPRDPARSALYYEKACDAGHGTACAQLGRRPATTTSGSSAASRSGGMLVAIAFALLVGVAVVVLRRRGAASDGGGPRPAPVRPALPRSSR